MEYTMKYVKIGATFIMSEFICEFDTSTTTPNNKH